MEQFAPVLFRSLLVPQVQPVQRDRPAPQALSGPRGQVLLEQRAQQEPLARLDSQVLLVPLALPVLLAQLVQRVQPVPQEPREMLAQPEHLVPLALPVLLAQPVQRDRPAPQVLLA